MRTMIFAVLGLVLAALPALARDTASSRSTRPAAASAAPRPPMAAAPRTARALPARPAATLRAPAARPPATVARRAGPPEATLRTAMLRYTPPSAVPGASSSRPGLTRTAAAATLPRSRVSVATPQGRWSGVTAGRPAGRTTAQAAARGRSAAAIPSYCRTTRGYARNARACGAPQVAQAGGDGGFGRAGWQSGLSPASGDQRSCPEGTMATLARGHTDIVRCVPM